MGQFSASINNDPLHWTCIAGCNTARQVAEAASVQGAEGEVILVVGPRGGQTKWRIVGRRSVVAA